MQKTAFVTGGTGFLGGHIIRLLIENGWQVTALHRPETNPQPLLDLGATAVAGTLYNTESITAVMPEHVDAVFHVAANTSMWSKHNSEQHRDNVEGTAAMVAAALTQKAKRFIYTSSISAWGIIHTPINEDTPSNALNSKVHYHRSKYLAEQEVRKGIEKGLDAVILNPCGILGAGDRHNWSQMIMLINQGKLPGVPPGCGNFCHVNEVAQAHLSAFEKGRKGANYILAGEEATFLEMARTIAFLLNRPGPKRTLPVPVITLAGHLYPLFSLFSGKEPSLTPEKVAQLTHRVIANSDRAVTELGFNDKVPLQTMLQQCIDWMRREKLLSE